MANRKRSGWVGQKNDYSDFSMDTSSNKGRDFTLIAGTVVATVTIMVLVINLFGLNLDFTNSKPNTNIAAGTTNTNNAPQYANTNQSGQVALSETELRAEVAKISVPVYWVGPQQGAKYTLENQANARIFVRYLPDGKIPPTGEASKRVIGTYRVANAFQTTKSAGSSVANGVGVTGPSGEAIFYVQSNPKNVYVAFPGVDAQIEIFDPETGGALKLATQKGLVQVIK